MGKKGTNKGTIEERQLKRVLKINMHNMLLLCKAQSVKKGCSAFLLRAFIY